MSTLADRPVVAAAGGAVWRPGTDGGVETAVVHRPKYDDWSLPKGKLDRGEHALAAAVREVREETGLAVRAGRRTLRTCYPVAEGTKRVDYWVMRAADGRFTPNSEVDQLRWLPPDDAARLLTHDDAREVVADLARENVPRMPSVLMVRHASAGDRTDWDGPDELRPLDGKGRRQAQRLAEVLPLFGPTAILSALPTRCTETVRPLAERLGQEVLPLPAVGEEEFADDPQAAISAMEQLLQSGRTPGVTVVCSQGGAIPSMLMALGVRWADAPARLHPPAAKGSVWALGGCPGRLVADYYHDFDADPDAPGA